LNGSSTISTLDSNFSGYKDVLEQGNKIAEKQNSLKEEEIKLLGVLISKISENNAKQEQILISNKNLLQALSHGSPGCVEFGSGSADQPTDTKNEVDLTSSKSSEESVVPPLGFQFTGAQGVYKFPDAELETDTSKEDLAFRFGNLIMAAIQRSLMVPDIDFTKYLPLGVVPFVLDMASDVEKVLKNLEAIMQVLDIPPSSKKPYNQFLALASFKEDSGYFVLVGCRHPLAPKDPPTVLVICDHNAPDLSDKHKEIATELWKFFIGTKGIVDGVEINFVRINFDADPQKDREFFSYLRPTEHFLTVPHARIQMAFKFYYNFCCCLGTIASIFITNVVGTDSMLLRKRIEKKLQAYNDSPQTKKEVNIFMSSMVMESFKSIRDCGDFVNLPEGETKDTILVQVRKKVDGVFAAVSKTLGNKEDDKMTGDRKRKALNSAAGKEKKPGKK
jgi:hypothetical protein